MELIDRDALLCKIMLNIDKSYYERYIDLANDILKAPKVDAMPIIHANWDYMGARAPQCTHCGMFAPYAKYKRKNGIEAGELTDYCPSCGAKMDEGEDEHEE